jgi:N-acetyl-anhydromuramyl-L-alanine amidase AmpD
VKKLRCAPVAAFFLLAAVASHGMTTAPLVIDRLMPATNYDERPSSAVVDTIMLHFSSDLIRNPNAPFSVDRIFDIYVRARVSTHYLVDRDGHIYRFVDEKNRARHAGKGTVPWAPERTNDMNQHSLGIEILAIGSARDMRPFMKEARYRDYATSHPEFVGYTDAQYEALNQLIGDIMSRHPVIRKDRYHIMGHEDYAPGRKTDPGELFDWSRIGLPKSCPWRPSDRQTTQPAALTTRESITSGTPAFLQR